MRYIAIVLLAMLAACDSSTSEVAAPAPDPFYEGAPERPRIRLTVLAGTKKAPAAVGRVRIEARWPEIWSTSADSGIVFGGGDTAWIVEGDAERMPSPLQASLFFHSRGITQGVAVIEISCDRDSTLAFAKPFMRTMHSIAVPVEAWQGEKVAFATADDATVTVFCKD